jgi:hypothetical protein
MPPDEAGNIRVEPGRISTGGYDFILREGGLAHVLLLDPTASV